MIRFASFNDLLRINSEIAAGPMLKTASASREGKDTFLAHSSLDKVFLPAAIEILTNHGAGVYIDKEDERLPEHTSPETAAVLRETIRGCRKFVFLVTPRSKESKWVPWELGLGDGIKAPSNVALFPSAEVVTETTWAEQEYLGLYRRIVWANFSGETDPQWAVYNHITNTGVKLREWIRN